MSKTLVLQALDCYSEDLTLCGKNKQGTCEVSIGHGIGQQFAVLDKQYAVELIKYLKEEFEL